MTRLDFTAQMLSFLRNVPVTVQRVLAVQLATGRACTLLANGGVRNPRHLTMSLTLHSMVAAGSASCTTLDWMGQTRCAWPWPWTSVWVSETMTVMS
jgi:hypothetical protein